MIHLENQNEVYDKRYVWIWLISAFKAGFINSAGFLATGKFVSHVTGFGTQVGIAVGIDDFFFGAELLIIPMAFILGGVVTSAILDRKYGRQETPPYHLVQGLISLLIVTVIILGEEGVVNLATQSSGVVNHDLSEFLIITLLCFICGLKNSLVTWTTKGKIRVSHLTGLSTDIGLHLIRTFRPGQASPQFQENRIVNIIRIFTFVAFSGGAFISALVFPRLGYKCFFLVLAISVLMTVLALYDRRKQQLKASEEMEKYNFVGSRF